MSAVQQVSSISCLDQLSSLYINHGFWMNLIDFQFFWASLLDQGVKHHFLVRGPIIFFKSSMVPVFWAFDYPLTLEVIMPFICLYVHFAVAFIDFLLYMLVICPCGVRYISILFMSRARQCHLRCTDYIILLSTIHSCDMSKSIHNGK